MNIALTTPNYWPYYRRGTARFVDNLSRFLARKGHKVTLITSKPGRGKKVEKDGVSIVYFPYVQHPLFLNHGLYRRHFFALHNLAIFLKSNFDVIYCMSHPEGYAASLAGKLKRIRFVQNITSVPFGKYYPGLPLDEHMFRRSLSAAHGVAFPSRYSRDCAPEGLTGAGSIIPMPVDTSSFAPCASRDSSRPMVLFVSDLGDRRKGLSLVLQAFAGFQRKVPGARLVLAGQSDLATARNLAASLPGHLRDCVHLPGQGRLRDLPFLYSRASMTILPSLYEVFGMVLLESLACGTPVVGSDSGALPEIITSEEIGRLYTPMPSHDEPTNVEGLLEAMLETFELSRKPETAEACRRHAKFFDIERVGALFENYLAEKAAG